MEAVGFDPVLDAIAQREAQTEAEAFGTQDLGREEFLKLLIAQLENQDPMKPAEDTEFVAQLATFSSLEQLIAANDNLQSLALGQANLINSQALNLIGKDALVETDGQISIADGRAEEIVYSLPRPAQSATLTLFAPDGSVAKVVNLETTPGGRIAVDLEPVDAEGEPLPDGVYRFSTQATDLDGKPMSLAVFESLPIDAVAFEELGISLISGEREIPFDQIMEIRSPR